ncbi:MAG: 3'-5' exonuclease [Thermodesulfobacteriota bacterium]
MLAPPERLGFDRRMTKDEINSLPIRSYEGKVVVVKTREELDIAVRKLGKETLLGFDTETRPNFKKGQNNLPSLIQLAGEKTVYIFQLQHIKFPANLREILADKTIIKTGVAIDHDLLQLQRFEPFMEGGFAGLARLAKNAGIKNHGLRGLAAVLLNFRISKSAQRSNWGNDTLSNKQINYAATDAWVGREIFLRLEEMGVIDPALLFGD